MPKAFCDIRLIASDMDGTLLTDEHRITPLAKAAIARIWERGTHFCLCSGRVPASMRPYVEEIGTETPYIAGNGTSIIDAKTHKAIWSHMLSAQLARAVLALSEEMGVYAHTYTNDDFIYPYECAEAENYKASCGLSGKCAGALSKSIDFDVPKVIFICEPKKALEVRDRVLERFSGNVECVLSQPNFAEIIPKGASKGAALKRLCDMMNIPMRTVMAFGDGQNDVSMLRACGISVAPDDAQSYAKDTADFICPRHGDDGVAKFITSHILRGESE
ncbi:MAG: Cof-type HAD-IIB family hydrolase [Eubacteriales bacterium]|nr:Cof-type HAD-IIB family hydrolase [Eubacteriales bacterium]MDD3882351.1 Cof-type HAD-IIB family hydrolase [Eubacteriales bacterium]MDD4512428.1 Cof-type HAD-IIB family hydrolase [Eubacteriales bacterium]